MRLSLFSTVMPKPPVLFCANSSTGAALWGVAETCQPQSLYISYVSTCNVPARYARLTREKAAFKGTKGTWQGQSQSSAPSIGYLNPA